MTAIVSNTPTPIMSIDSSVEFQSGGAAVHHQPGSSRRQSPCPQCCAAFEDPTCVGNVTILPPPSHQKFEHHQFQSHYYGSVVTPANSRYEPYAVSSNVLTFSPPPHEFSTFYHPDNTAHADIEDILKNPYDSRRGEIYDLVHGEVYYQARNQPKDIALLHLKDPAIQREAKRLQEKFFTMETFFNSSCPGHFKNYQSSALYAPLTNNQFTTKLKKLEDHLVKEDFVPFLAGQITFEYGGLACLAFILEMMYPTQPPAKIVPVYIKKDDCLRLYVHKSMAKQLKAAHRCRLLCDRHGWMHLAQTHEGARILREYGNNQVFKQPSDWKVSRFPITLEEKKIKTK